MKTKHLGLRIDEELHWKLRYLSAAEGRSVSGQILYVIRECVLQYEKQNGPIPKEQNESRKTSGI